MGYVFVTVRFLPKRLKNNKHELFEGKLGIGTVIKMIFKKSLNIKFDELRKPLILYLNGDLNVVSPFL